MNEQEVIKKVIRLQRQLILKLKGEIDHLREVVNLQKQVNITLLQKLGEDRLASEYEKTLNRN